MNAAGVSRKWEFQARFRRHAFGWRSQPAILRVKQAVSEITRAERRDPVLAAEGAVLLLERISPALENVDSSSGGIGIAVNNAIARLVPIIADAPAGITPREQWLERCGRPISPTRFRTLNSLVITGANCAAQKKLPRPGPTGWSASPEWRSDPTGACAATFAARSPA